MNPKSGHTDVATRSFLFRVLRSAADAGIEPRFDTFELDLPPGTTVLDALFAIQREHDGSLAFRYSCRGAVCGSCGMTINGRCGLACRMQLWSSGGNEVVIEPLPNLDVIRDLVVDMTPFWEKYRRVRPWLHREVERAADESTIDHEQHQSPRQLSRIERYTHCILCACCYGACPVLKRQREYLGPAALAKLLRFAGDSRDHRPPAALADVDSEGEGVWGCDTVFRCIDACPVDVRPTDGIAALRRRLVTGRVKRST